MIDSKKKLKEYLRADSKNYKAIAGKAGLKMWVASRFLSNPISDQSKIWSYIKALRYTEYYGNKANKTVWGG